jgi:hypothetical protein
LVFVKPWPFAKHCDTALLRESFGAATPVRVPSSQFGQTPCEAQTSRFLEGQFADTAAHLYTSIDYTILNFPGVAHRCETSRQHLGKRADLGVLFGMLVV